MPRREYDSDLDERPRRRYRRVKHSPNTNPAMILVGAGIGLLLIIGASVTGYLLLRGKAAPLGLVDNPGVCEVDRLAGQWECTFRDPAGNVTMHKVKEIIGKVETATWYRPNGTVFRINRVEFELMDQGQRKTFRYFNGWATDEFGTGQPFPSGEYVYTLDGDTWTEYMPSGGTIVWTRRK